MLFGYGPPERDVMNLGTGPAKMGTGTPTPPNRSAAADVFGYRTPEHEPRNLSAGAVEMDTGTPGTR